MTDDQDQPPDRPPARDKTVGVRVDPALYAKAEAKAKKSGRSLGAILRSFFFLWAEDEIGDPPVLPGESTRAKKRPKKQSTKKK